MRLATQWALISMSESKRWKTNNSRSVPENIFPNNFFNTGRVDCGTCASTGHAYYTDVHLDASTGDVDHFENVNNADKCAEKCSTRNNCGGFSYIPDGQECILKKKTINQADTTAQGDISGIKCELDPFCANIGTTTSTSTSTGTTTSGEGDCNQFQIESNPRANQHAFKHFTKFVNVLDCWGVYAEEGISDEKVIFVAAMSAQILDNNEDGIVDDPLLEAASTEHDGLIAIFVNEEGNIVNHWYENGSGGAVLFNREIDPNNPGIFQKDATFEEVTHNINILQSNLYSDKLGLSNSALTVAMDIARGGHFVTVPNTYPAGAWYTYDDTTCEYECMLIEYIYWGSAAFLGYLDDQESCQGISNEWDICNAEQLEQIDEKLYAIVTDPVLKLPSIRPDDKYCPGSSETTPTGTTPTGTTPTGTTPTGTTPNGNECHTFTVENNPRANQNAFKKFSKYVNVLDCWSVFAEDSVSDEDVMYVAAMSAQILDNNEDGIVDDPALELASLQYDGLIAIFEKEDNAAYNHWGEYGTDGAVLFTTEINPQFPGKFGEDATFEEVLHNVNTIQSYVYPDFLSIDNTNSALAQAMDVARGGHFQNVPNSYPAGAWYTYDDTTCEYECMLIEYLYWGTAAFLGYLDDPQSCQEIANEWDLCNRQQLQQIDQQLYEIITNPTLKMPMNRPDDKYCPQTTTEPPTTTSEGTTTTADPCPCTDDVNNAINNGLTPFMAKFSQIKHLATGANSIGFAMSQTIHDADLNPGMQSVYDGYLVMRKYASCDASVLEKFADPSVNWYFTDLTCVGCYTTHMGGYYKNDVSNKKKTFTLGFHFNGDLTADTNKQNSVDKYQLFVTGLQGLGVTEQQAYDCVAGAKPANMFNTDGSCDYSDCVGEKILIW